MWEVLIDGFGRDLGTAAEAYAAGAERHQYLLGDVSAERTDDFLSLLLLLDQLPDAPAVNLREE